MIRGISTRSTIATGILSRISRRHVRTVAGDPVLLPVPLPAPMHGRSFRACRRFSSSLPEKTPTGSSNSTSNNNNNKSPGETRGKSQAHGLCGELAKLRSTGIGKRPERRGRKRRRPGHRRHRTRAEGLGPVQGPVRVLGVCLERRGYHGAGGNHQEHRRWSLGRRTRGSPGAFPGPGRYNPAVGEGIAGREPKQKPQQGRPGPGAGSAGVETPVLPGRRSNRLLVLSVVSDVRNPFDHRGLRRMVHHNAERTGAPRSHTVGPGKAHTRGRLDPGPRVGQAGRKSAGTRLTEIRHGSVRL
mmetsp:Transcript_17194/g.35524  ORF Transcript_17194/g.35524 Transcript_17194/m.35524 type:complete len:300 (+) Transcript_17194:156-1055(+)